jgi:hypothetical protein
LIKVKPSISAVLARPPISLDECSNNVTAFPDGDDSYSIIVLQDLARLSIWIRLLTKDVDMDDFDTEYVSRPVLF